MSKKSDGRKRKIDETCLDNEEVGKIKEQRCIIHFEQSRNEVFTSLLNLKDPDERLSQLQNIADIRSTLPPESTIRYQESCDLIPKSWSLEDGYHRDCYQRFTKNIDRISNIANPSTSATNTRHKRNLSTNKIVFEQDCIICNKDSRKNIKVKGSWTTESTSKFEFDGGSRIVECAQLKCDEKLLTRIRGVDLFACEARFHPSCRREYLRESTYTRSSNEDNKFQQENMERSHNEAFEKLCNYIDANVIQSKIPLTLKEACKYYVSVIDDSCKNLNYRADKIKQKLERKYGDVLMFMLIELVKGKKQYIIMRNDLDTCSMIEGILKMHPINTITDAAFEIRQDIWETYEATEDLPWPPTVDVLVCVKETLPTKLMKFLNIIISGGQGDVLSSKVNRLIMSLGQDICRATTSGQWKLPKHILLCMTLRHLFRSAELTTLLNRFGHVESYSFSLELETAIAKAVDTSSSFLTNQIVRHPENPYVFHSEFDNFDKLINDLSGQGSIHTAHGIMLQDIEGEIPETITLPVIHDENGWKKRGKERSLHLALPDIPECIVTKRKSPPMIIDRIQIEGYLEAVQIAKQKEIIWLILRKSSVAFDYQQSVPGYSGFLSQIGSVPERLTAIDYYPVINKPITEYSTVQQCLINAEEATSEVGQEYVITTFDLGVCMKAYPIVWNNPERYSKHIILIGSFHVLCAFMKMVGKKMDGSGFSDVLLEANLVGSGSISGVLSGKNYNRAMHCHKAMLEALERLLFELFAEKQDDATLSMESLQLLEEFIINPNSATLDSLTGDDNISQYIINYTEFREEIKQGLHGKTAQFWISYMNHVWLILDIQQAVKFNDLPLYCHTLSVMSGLFFSFGGQNYARYLTYFSVFLANIETTHPGSTDLLKKGAISVARSLIPGNRCAVDKTMEETFMKHSKSHAGAGGAGAGLSGLLNKYDTYQRWVRTAHERTKIVEKTFSIADMLSSSTSGSQHKDLRPSQIKTSERSVIKTMDAFNSFLHPFNQQDKDSLYIVSSGAPVSKEVEDDVLRAEKAGNEAKATFIEQRLKKKEKFFDPVKRLGLKTMQDMSKTIKIKTAQNKVIEYRNQGNLAMQLLVKSRQQGGTIDLEELMSFQLTPVPYSIGTNDGFLVKTDKSKGVHFLLKDVEDSNFPPKDSTLLIEDGNALFYVLRDISANFKDISEQVFGLIPKGYDAVFSTDSYNVISIKSVERQRRGCGQKLIIQGPKTKRPKDWKSFLNNDDNKRQLISCLATTWLDKGFSRHLKGRKIIFIENGTASLMTSDGVNSTTEALTSLDSSQEETDSRVVLYCHYAEDHGYKQVIVRSPDSDIFFILLHHANDFHTTEILFQTGHGNRKRLLSITSIASTMTPQYCSALLGLHAFTGCDSTSAFKGIGKVKPIKLMQKHPKFQATLAKLGNNLDVDEQMNTELEILLCTLYGKPRIKTINSLRHHLLLAKCGDSDKLQQKNIDFGSLPPCRSSFEEHIKRVNFQVRIWKSANIANPDIPSPTEGHGWTLGEHGPEPLWTSDPILPEVLTELITSSEDSDDESSDQDDDEPEEDFYDGSSSSDDD